MKVALVQCPAWGRKSPPFAIALLSAILRSKGHEVYCFDLNNGLYHSCEEKHKKMWGEEYYSFWEDFYLMKGFIDDNGKNIDNYVKKILEVQPDIVGFSIHCTSSKVSLEIAKRLKAQEDKILIVFGGPSCIKDRGALCFIREDFVDVVVVGEGGITLPELINTYRANGKIDYIKGIIYKDNGRIVECISREVIEDVEQLPFPDFTDFDFDSYIDPHRLEVFSSRGCFNRCVFCGEKEFWHRFRYMKGERIFKEIKFQLGRYKNISQVVFNDSLLNGVPRELDIFCDAVIQHKLMFAWGGQALPRKEMTLSLLKKMKEAGCWYITYGIESGSQKVLDRMKKSVNIEDVEKVVRYTHEAGIKTYANFMFGFPGERDDNFQETLDFLKRNRDFLDGVSPSQSFCVIDKNTYLYQHSLEFDILPEPHHLYWQTKDGYNNYAKRFKRYEQFCNLALSMRLTGVGVVDHKPDKWQLLGDYYYYKKDWAKAIDAYHNSVKYEHDNKKTHEKIADCFNKIKI